MSARSSQGSAGWTTDSIWPTTAICSSAKSTRGDVRSLPHGGPECPSTRTSGVSELTPGEDMGEAMRVFDPKGISPRLKRRSVLVLTECPSTTTYETFAWQQGAVKEGNQDSLNLFRDISLPLSTSRVQAAVDLLCGGFPVRTSQSQADAQASPGPGQGCSMSSPGSSTLFNPDGFSSRTYPGCSPRTAVGTSEASLERWPTSGTAWLGGFSTHVTSECRSAGGVCSSWEPALTEILQEPHTVPARYSLSARAATGILRRAQRRGRALPPHLLSALSQLTRQADGVSEGTATKQRAVN